VETAAPLRWIVLLLLGLAEGLGLLHTAVHAHVLSPVTGKIVHLHGRDDGPPCPGRESPAPAEEECQVFAVFALSATPSAPPPLPVWTGPAPDLAPWRAPDLAPVKNPFALWLLAPSLSPPALLS
jgi:hypothetical protein